VHAEAPNERGATDWNDARGGIYDLMLRMQPSLPVIELNREGGSVASAEVADADLRIAMPCSAHGELGKLQASRMPCARTFAGVGAGR